MNIGLLQIIGQWAAINYTQYGCVYGSVTQEDANKAVLYFIGNGINMLIDWINIFIELSLKRRIMKSISKEVVHDCLYKTKSYLDTVPDENLKNAVFEMPNAASNLYFGRFVIVKNFLALIASMYGFYGDEKRKDKKWCRPDTTVASFLHSYTIPMSFIIVSFVAYAMLAQFTQRLKNKHIKDEKERIDTIGDVFNNQTLSASLNRLALEEHILMHHNTKHILLDTNISFFNQFVESLFIYRLYAAIKSSFLIDADPAKIVATVSKFNADTYFCSKISGSLNRMFDGYMLAKSASMMSKALDVIQVGKLIEKGKVPTFRKPAVEINIVNFGY